MRYHRIWRRANNNGDGAATVLKKAAAVSRCLRSSEAVLLSGTGGAACGTVLCAWYWPVVLACGSILRTRYAMSGTELAYAATGWRDRHGKDLCLSGPVTSDPRPSTPDPRP
eukprot:1330244-Rhodomonas_salina.1